MLSAEERRLIAGIVAILLFGAAVKACRSEVATRETPQVALPTVDR